VLLQSKKKTKMSLDDEKMDFTCVQRVIFVGEFGLVSGIGPADYYSRWRIP
jgi:hypothetical protein